MKLKLRDVVNASSALDRLDKCHPKKARDTYRVARLMREIDPILKDYEKTRQRFLEQYAIKSKTEPNRWLFIMVDEDGEPILEYSESDKEKKNGKTILNVGAIDAFSREIDEMLDSEDVDIAGFITLAQIERLGLDPAMSPDEMAALWWLIAEFQDADDQAEPDGD